MANDTISLTSDVGNDVTVLPAVSLTTLQQKYSQLRTAADDVTPGSSGAGNSGILSEKKITGSKRNNVTKEKPSAAEREAKKQKIAEDKAAKKIADEINKVYKPGECMKYMSVEFHPTLWSSWWCADVHQEITVMGAKVVQAPQLIHPSLVVWSRSLPRFIDKDSGELKLSPSVESCDRALYVTSMEEVAEYVHSHSLASHLMEIKTLADRDLTLVLFGYKDYFNTTRRKTSNSNRTPMTDVDLELALTDLLVEGGCDSGAVSTPNELARFIAQHARAAGEAPHRRAERARCYVRGDSKQTVAVDRAGVGVSRLWQQMIAILPHSSLETSRALCAKYKSPLALFEALQSPSSVNEIADIGVSRAAVPGSKARRLGPEFAKKLKILFTADDGNTLVS